MDDRAYLETLEYQYNLQCKVAPLLDSYWEPLIVKPTLKFIFSTRKSWSTIKSSREVSGKISTKEQVIFSFIIQNLASYILKVCKNHVEHDFLKPIQFTTLIFLLIVIKDRHISWIFGKRRNVSFIMLFSRSILCKQTRENLRRKLRRNFVETCRINKKSNIKVFWDAN